MSYAQAGKPVWLHQIPVTIDYPDEMYHHIKGHMDSGHDHHAAFIEREVFVDVLKSIAIGVEDPKLLALKALRTLDLRFKR